VTRPIKPSENDTETVTAAKLTKLLGKDVELTDVEEIRKKLADVRQRIADAEVAKRPKRDQTCAKCGGAIPHGSPFVPILRYVQRGHVHDPHFIGRQPVSWGVETESVGALCFVCLDLTFNSVADLNTPAPGGLPVTDKEG
jgi:hypothetical protein